MRKLLSYRNIAGALFVFTFFIFVLAQQYTRKNGAEQNSRFVSSSLQVDSASQAIDQPTPAAIIAR